MSAVPAIPVNPTMTQRLTALDKGQRLRLALGLALLVVVAVVGIVMSRQQEWRVLYANLSDKDGGAIIGQLSTMNIPYRHAEGGSAILVPADRVHDTRLRLATLGLPKGSVAGFESLEAAGSRFGMTQFQERLLFQRGLEGELTRSIQSLSSVQNARVHLALPNNNGFFREQQKPSASVLVSLYPGRMLDRAQVAGIVHLVASSVPEMSVDAVSVLDDSGKLLSKPADAMAGGPDAQQLQYVQQIEQTLSRRILDILEPVVGRDNVKAQVTAEVDFSQTEQTSEEHKPNQKPETAAVRSQQSVESLNGAANANQPPTGVPGATTNQPPPQPSAPINGPAQQLATAGAAAAGAGGNSKRESIINYEVDKTVRVVRGGTGMVRRLTAAVVLNNQSVTDDKGKTSSVPFTDQQLARMTALVREAIGYSQERGDSVNLMNAPFAKDKSGLPELPLWQQPEVRELARSLAWPVGLAVLGTLVLLFVVRPALRDLGRSRADAQFDALLAEEPERPDLAPAKELPPPGPTPGEKALEDARKLTRDNPAAVASIVKGWINNELPG